MECLHKHSAKVLEGIENYVVVQNDKLTQIIEIRGGSQRESDIVSGLRHRSVVFSAYCFAIGGSRQVPTSNQSVGGFYGIRQRKRERGEFFDGTSS